MFGIVWNDLEQIDNQRSKFWIWSSCDWALEDPILRHTVIIFKKSRPKNRFVSITYHFFQQNFVQYFCMHLVYPARLVLSWYLKISWHWSYQGTIWFRPGQSSPDLVPRATSMLVPRATSMLVTDVGDEMCWWQLWDVGVGFVCYQT